MGNFKVPGVKWDRAPERVNDHDFRSQVDGLAIPYGVCNLKSNTGIFFVGTMCDPLLRRGLHRDVVAHRGLPALSWGQERLHPRRQRRQQRLHAPGLEVCPVASPVQSPRLSVTVSHYPTATSKWHPVEHRLFSEISKNWTGQPLTSFETTRNYLRTTSATTGLSVRAHLIAKPYEKGVKVTDRQMRQLRITAHKNVPRWNYTIAPC